MLRNFQPTQLNTLLFANVHIVALRIYSPKIVIVNVNTARVKWSHATAASSAIVFIVLLSWTNNLYQYEMSEQPAADEVFMTIDEICGDIIDSNADWATKKFEERYTHHFCSQDCLEAYLRLIK